MEHKSLIKATKVITIGSAANSHDSFTGASFTLKNRLGRIMWNMVYTVFFRPSPAVLHGWRSFILRCFGAKTGKGIHVYPKVKIWAPWNLQLDDQCGIANGVTLYSQDVITIGCRAVISQDSYICTGTHDYTLKGHPLITFPVIIGDHAWIAAGAFIHPGITIGDGAVIGARSVVTRDMPEWMVCGGYPCKPLKKRVMKPV